METELQSLDELISSAVKNNKEVKSSITDRAHGYLHGLISNFSFSVSNDTARIVIHDKHEISIYNRYNYGQPWCFRPEINWFGSSSTCQDETVLDYLIALGVLAKDLKNPIGFCRGYLSDLMVELHDTQIILEDLYQEKHVKLRTDAADNEKLILEKATTNLKIGACIQVNLFQNSKNKHDHPFDATLKLLYITDKTVAVSVYRRGEDVPTDTKKISRDEFLSRYKYLLSDLK